MQKEVVVEIERVQLIRKRAKTYWRFCTDCEKQTDFISLDEAAALFITGTDSMFRFISVNTCHFQTETNGDVCICLVALLETMRIKSGSSRIKLIGDRSNDDSNT